MFALSSWLQFRRLYMMFMLKNHFSIPIPEGWIKKTSSKLGENKNKKQKQKTENIKKTKTNNFERYLHLSAARLYL